MCVFTLQIMPQNCKFCFVLLFGLCIISRQNGPDRVKNTAFSFKVRKPTFFWNHAKISHTFFSKVQKLRIIIHSPMTTYKICAMAATERTHEAQKRHRRSLHARCTRCAGFFELRDALRCEICIHKPWFSVEIAKFSTNFGALLARDTRPAPAKAFPKAQECMARH